MTRKRLNFILFLCLSGCSATDEHQDRCIASLDAEIVRQRAMLMRLWAEVDRIAAYHPAAGSEYDNKGVTRTAP